MAGKFEPKEPVQLAEPKSDPISPAELAEATGEEGKKCFVAIKGIVYDVTGKDAYQAGGPYHAFAGKDATRALALMSTKKDDVVAGWEDLSEKEKGVLDGWVTYFSKRYNVVGVVDASSTAS